MANLIARAVDLARRIVVGEEFATDLQRLVRDALGLDSVGVHTWATRANGPTLGIPLASCVQRTFTGSEWTTMEELLTQHPAFGRDGIAARLRVFRLSDHLDLPSFWRTPVFEGIHGQFGHEYPGAITLGPHAGAGLFVGFHSAGKDVTPDQLQAVDDLREPLASAITFRQALDNTLARLTSAGETIGVPTQFTAREGEVVGLVARGWTDSRIATTLGISVRTARKHLASAREKIHAQNRAEAAAWWTRHVSTA